MPFVVKLLITNLVIVGCAHLGRKIPSMAGLIATMPITTLAVLLWIHSEHPTDQIIITDYTRGALWGVIPTAIFFMVALFCFKREIALPITLTASFTAWLAGAALHQWMLR